MEEVWYERKVEGRDGGGQWGSVGIGCGGIGELVKEGRYLVSTTPYTPGVNRLDIVAALSELGRCLGWKGQ